jgi:hypothetical protein
VFDASQKYIERINAELNQAYSLFVAGTTSDYKKRYKLPGGGYMQRRAANAGGGAVRAYGEWDVAFPIEDFDEQVAGDWVDLRYMTMAEYQRHLDTIQARYVNTFRFEMLLKLVKNTNTTFNDPRKGALTIVPLANGDTVTYPPVLGSDTEATDTHYLESGYAATAIDDTNDPYATIYEELVQHFGDRTGGESVVVFINPAETPETKAMTDFDAVLDKDIRAGANVSIPERLPNVPGKIIGKVSGCWVSEWRYMPANYMFGIHLEEEAPLMMRIDPPETGIPAGLSLRSNDTAYPFETARWGARFGFGVANRLNGVVMELGTGGTYTIPTAYQ